MPLPTVTVVAGGPSPEHIASLETAIGILQHRHVPKIQPRFRLAPCLITASGLWLDEATSERALAAYQVGGSDIRKRLDDVVSSGTSLPPWQVVSSSAAVFPAIHGALGEDGVILGLCRALDIPFVGCDILTSAICLDKAVCNSVLQAAKVPQTPSITILPSEDLPSLEIGDLLLPWIIKPADGGCSIGVSLITSAKDLPNALAKARKCYPESSILVETAVQNFLEIDVAVMEVDFDDATSTITLDSDSNLLVTPCGLRQNFNHETASSASPGTTNPAPRENQNQGDIPSWSVPAPDLPAHISKKIQAFAKRVFRVLRATRFLRVDFFYVPATGDVLVNEINSMPSMARGSMWFKLWAAMGISEEDWILMVVEGAVKRGEDGKLGKMLQREKELKEQQERKKQAQTRNLAWERPGRYGNGGFTGWNRGGKPGW